MDGALWYNRTAFPNPERSVPDFFAFAGFISILVLMAIRQKNHPRSAAGEDGRRSRFFGSTWWQAYYVELTILGVTICIISLRALEYALDFNGGTTGFTGKGHADALHGALLDAHLADGDECAAHAAQCDALRDRAAEMRRRRPSRTAAGATP